MWLIRAALRRPISILVAVIAVAMTAVFAISRMRVDIFPDLNLPTIYVALEDLGRPDEALQAYENAAALEPDNADAHYNAASLCERQGRIQDALRHLKSYRNILRGVR